MLSLSFGAAVGGRLAGYVAGDATISYMAYPTSLRLPESVKDRLERNAARNDERPAALAVRLIDEGLRMADHPGVVFHDSPTHGRVASLAGGPDVAEVIEVLTGLESQGEDRMAETATWFGIHPARIRVLLAYYTEHRQEIDTQIQRRQQEAKELRRRHEAQQALLG
ncbi:MAG: hypothetical protein ACRDVM_02875 [Acidimicrobiia bacterium]